MVNIKHAINKLVFEYDQKIEDCEKLLKSNNFTKTEKERITAMRIVYLQALKDIESLFDELGDTKNI